MPNATYWRCPGRAVEAAGDVNTLLLDKTGTITLGNRQASDFIAVGGCHAGTIGRCGAAVSLADETPEGRSVVVYAKATYGLECHTAQRGSGRHGSLGAIARTSEGRSGAVPPHGDKAARQSRGHTSRSAAGRAPCRSTG